MSIEISEWVSRFIERIVVEPLIRWMHTHRSISTCTSHVKVNQFPTHSVLIEIYSGIARFPCNSTAFVSYLTLHREIMLIINSVFIPIKSLNVSISFLIETCSLNHLNH